MPKKLLVWDLPLRLFHWLLVVAIACAWVTIELLEDLQLHFYAGYSVLTLLLFRIFWGIFGSHYALFSRLFEVQSGLSKYLRGVFKADQSPIYAGHNPLGSLAVIAMLVALLVQTGTGMFSSDDYLFGPLAGLLESPSIDQVTQWHHLGFEALQILIALHVLAILLYRLVKRQSLTSAMLHGHKHLPPDTVDQAPTTHPASLMLAMIMLLISAAIVYVLVNHVAEPVPLSSDFF